MEIDQRNLFWSQSIRESSVELVYVCVCVCFICGCVCVWVQWRGQNIYNTHLDYKGIIHIDTNSTTPQSTYHPTPPPNQPHIHLHKRVDVILAVQQNNI